MRLLKERVFFVFLTCHLVEMFVVVELMVVLPAFVVSHVLLIRLELRQVSFQCGGSDVRSQSFWPQTSKRAALLGLERGVKHLAPWVCPKQACLSMKRDEKTAVLFPCAWPPCLLSSSNQHILLGGTVYVKPLKRGAKVKLLPNCFCKRSVLECRMARKCFHQR